MITSGKNPRIQNLVKLSQSKHRRQQKLFLVEGDREVERALRASYEPVEIYVREDLSELAQSVLDQCEGLRPERVSEGVFKKIAYRERGGGGIVAVFRERSQQMPPRKERECWLVVEALEKPGNLGALLRGADGFGATGIVLVNHSGDLYHPHTIRASLGTVFHLAVLTMSAEELTQWSQSRELSLLISRPDAEESLLHMTLPPRVGFVLGSEAFGVSESFAEQKRHFKLPMQGVADSLNLSVASALMGYEWLRQMS